MPETLVRYESLPPAVVITLNRPDRRNALSRGLIAALTDAFARAAADGAARCVILTGAGSVFCAGMDLAELAESLQQADNKAGAAQSAVWEDALRLANLYDRIYCLRGDNVEAVWQIAARGMSQ